MMQLTLWDDGADVIHDKMVSKRKEDDMAEGRFHDSKWLKQAQLRLQQLIQNAETEFDREIFQHGLSTVVRDHLALIEQKKASKKQKRQ